MKEKRNSDTMEFYPGIRQGTIYFSLSLKEDITEGTYNVLLGRARDSEVDWLRAGRSGLLTPVETNDFFVLHTRPAPPWTLPVSSTVGTPHSDEFNNG